MLPQRAAAAEAGELAARVLAHRGRAQRRRAYEPTDLAGAHRRSREHVPLGDRARRPAASTSTARRCRSRSFVDPRDVGEDRPQPAVERLQVHASTGAIRVALARRRTGRRVLTVRGHRRRHSRGRAAARLRAVPPRSKARARARTKARASAWRWSRTGEAARRDHRGRRAGRVTAPRFTVGLPLGSAHLDPRTHRSRRPRPARARSAPQAFVAEAERWLRRRERRPTSEPTRRVAGGAATARGAHRRWPTTTPTCASTCAACSAARWQVEAVRNGREALDAVRRQRADLVDHRRDDAGARRLRPAERAAGGRARRATFRSSCCRRAPARRCGSKGCRPAPTTTWSSRSRRASCWRAWRCSSLRASMRAVEDLQRRQLADVFTQAPAGIAILRGPDHAFELANPTVPRLVGDRDVVGKPVREALPELAGQGIYELLDASIARASRTSARPCALMVRATPAQPPEECFFDFVYQPMRDATGDDRRHRRGRLRGQRPGAARGARPKRPTARRTSSSPCSATSCGTRWRRS